MSDAVREWTADLVLALDAVRAAGRPIMEAFRTDQDVRHKGPGQPVTDADLDANEMLAERLRAERPGYGWLSEESADRPERLGRSRVWIVDPIDGTRSFIAGYREFAVSVALAEDGIPVVGAVYNPARAHVVWATAGGGAWQREEWAGGTTGASRLELVGPAGDTLLVSRSELTAGEFEPFREGWTLEEVGSTAWKLAGAAMGRGAYISRGPKSEWDVAAGILVVREAGGVATDVDGNVVELNRREPYVHGVVAGRPESHARLLAAARTLPSPRLDRDEWEG